MNSEKPKVNSVNQYFSSNDMVIIENPQIWSAFGKMYKSTKETFPQFSFGKGTRSQQDKVYQDTQLAKTKFLCK